MDISVNTIPNANSTTATGSATVTAAGAVQAIDASGKSQTASTGRLTFTQLLDSQMSQESETVPTDAPMTLAGLIQMLQSLILPIQNVVKSENKDENGGGLPEILLQTMNSNEALADKLLQDPGLNQWFQQAQGMLATLLGKDASPIRAEHTLQTAGNVNNLQAQNTLLTLTSLLDEQPNNAVLQHITQDLQKLIEPLLPQIANGFSQTPEGQQQPDENGLEAPVNKVSANGSLNRTVSAQRSGLHAGSKHESSKQADLTKAVPSDLVAFQTAKSQLEWLAAKHAGNTAVSDVAAVSETNVEPQTMLLADQTVGNNPILQLSDMLKAPLPTEAALKPATQTIYAANFAQDMTEHMLKNMKITLAEGISEAKLSLFPKNLGHVDVKIMMHDGHLIAQFAADTLTGKQMLESQLPQLRQSLQSQGLLVEKLEVSQNLNMQSGMFQDQRQGQSTFQKSGQSKSKSSANYNLDNVDFIQELSSAAQTRIAGYNNSFDVTA
jgi:flagellar hook-length control protein FliK